LGTPSASATNWSSFGAGPPGRQSQETQGVAVRQEMHDQSHDLIAICASPTMAMPSTPADIMTGPARDCGHDSDTARLTVAMRIGCRAAVCSCHVVVTLSGRAGVGAMLHDRQPA
jgi:1,4-dihydroxy-2-naphthoate octaprenyltransferase